MDGSGTNVNASGCNDLIRNDNCSQKCHEGDCHTV